MGSESGEVRYKLKHILILLLLLLFESLCWLLRCAFLVKGTSTAPTYKRKLKYKRAAVMTYRGIHLMKPVRLYEGVLCLIIW